MEVLKGLEAPVREFGEVLGEVERGLEKIEVGIEGGIESRGEIGVGLGKRAKVKRMVGRLVWPFKRQETMGLVERLERCKATFLAALTAADV